MESRQMCCSTWGCINRSESEIHPIKKKKNSWGSMCLGESVSLSSSGKKKGRIASPSLFARNSCSGWVQISNMQNLWENYTSMELWSKTSFFSGLGRQSEHFSYQG